MSQTPLITLNLHHPLLSASGEMALQVKLNIAPGSFLTLYGPSGAGKTSLLRILAGLMRPAHGQIVVEGQTWLDTEQGINWPPQQRSTGFLFQDYALFPNMTVKENLSFALKKGQNKTIVRELIELMELGALRDRKPNSLSGGQQQRVALARALVQQPKLLMLDEPLSALDSAMRSKLQQHLLAVHRAYGLTTILVSHDAAEILRLSDWVVELEQGQVRGQGSPTEIFSHRSVSGKFQFIGEVVEITQEGFIFIVAILIGQALTRVVADQTEVEGLVAGDRVLVASKAFNPIIQKLP